MNAPATRKIYLLCITSIVAVHLLIFFGGVVRSTGSGMGCPDWPKCFGGWMPPTSVTQLPPDYKEIYSHHRDQKNIKFARFLYWIGATDKADELLNESFVSEALDFNVTKAWVEYINRLCGIIVGLLIVCLFFFSMPFKTHRPVIFIYSLCILIMVVIQGWVGSMVVSTNLMPWTITVHMFLALGIVAVLFFLLQESKIDRVPHKKKLPVLLLWMLIMGMSVLMIQIVLGTEVRKEVDELMDSTLPRKDWLSHLGTSFLIHRTFSLTVVVTNLILFLHGYKIEEMKNLSKKIMIAMGMMIFTGVGLAYLNMPIFLQPFHLVFASLLFGLQCYFFYRMNIYFKFRLY